MPRSSLLSKMRYAAVVSLVLDHVTSLSSAFTASSPSFRRSATTTSQLCATTEKLNKKSSALDVLRTLHRDDRLAPYVLSGGTAVVTGGNSGIGAVSVETLALAGLNVVLCARDVEAGAKVRAAVANDDARSRIRVQQLDLADLKSVERAASEIIASSTSIDVLLNNAGVMATPTREATAQGFELQLGTNHVGHHLLTRLLVPHLNQRDGRVVTVASTAHAMGELDLDDLNYDKKDGRTYSPWGAYGRSKLANILFAKGLQDRFNDSKSNGDSNMTSVSLHPGVIATNLWQYSIPSLLRPLGGLFADKTIEQGAATNVFCSLVAPSSLNGGDYYTDCRPKDPNQSGQDADKKLRNALWDETERMIRDAGFELPENL